MLRRMMIALLAAAAPIALAGPASDPPAEPAKDDGLHPRALLSTSLGDIVIELDAARAPVTVLNFLHYADNGHYSGTIFHRVMKDFMIQGGGYTADLEEKKGDLGPIKNEWRNGLKNARGTISMARLGRQPHSATAQFFINVVDNAGLDQPRDGAAYAVFGKVVEGMDVVDEIRDTEVVENPKLPMGQVVPKQPVVIKAVKISGKIDKEAIAKLAAESAERIARYDADPTLYQNEQVEPWITKAEQEGGNEVQTTESGLRYVTLKAGDGPTPPADAKVQVHYTGWLPDGTKFDSSVDRGQPFDFSLSGGVIKGWLEGVSTMSVGEKRRLIIPPDLGYGARGAGRVIPPNAMLIFDVELLAIQ